MNMQEPLEMVSPRYGRATDAVPGPFYVRSEQCITCALPPDMAPENIRFHHTPPCDNCSNYCYVHKQPQTPAELDLIIEAMCGSCVSAIRYCGTDPAILHRLREAGMAELCDAVS